MTAADPFETNKRNWNERVGIHVRSRTGIYRTEDFRTGQTVLGPIEAAEVGDVRGKRLLHLQCHFGLDTLSLARLGADVTGLDFSETAIAAARSLSTETGVPGHFVLGNVYDAPTLVDGLFDIVYVTWGAICWLPDIRRWGRIVADFLAPGGYLYLLETHPSASVLEQIDGRLVAHYDWRTPLEQPLVFDDDTTYTEDSDLLKNSRTCSWNHSLSDIVGGLLDQGLRLAFLREHETLPYRHVDMMVEAGSGMFRLPDGQPRLPLAFSLKMVRPDHA